MCVGVWVGVCEGVCEGLWVCMIVRMGNGLKCVNDLVGVNGSVGCVCKGVGE